MNKLTKAGIATAAAVALLMGGAGTLAYWNDSADLAGASVISAGNLDVEAGAVGSWVGISDIADYRIVPGDTLTFTQEITVTAQGDTLVANLALAPFSVAAASTAGEDVALAAALTESASFAVVSGSGAGVVIGNDTDTNAGNGGNGVLAGTVEFTPGAGTTLTTTLEVEVTITFPAGTLGQYNDAKTGQVSLDDFGVVLTQAI